ncbi:hypothetical protein EDD21DRAFT_368396 [Dissophora ornata]|nr:hypothetical protein EDD21DRAFT_368396 [Dissophora ornata]
MDHNFECLTPKRIRYYPGVVLKVVLENPNHDSEFTSDADTAQRTDDLHISSEIGGPTDTSLPAPPTNMTGETHMPQSQAIMSDQKIQEIQKDMTLQSRLNQIQNPMEQPQEPTIEKHEERKESQQQKMQLQTLEYLPTVQNRIREVIAHTYELHEKPIPRLFIVLPKASRRRDKSSKPLSRQFRLFFLCECGSHTMSQECETPHKIHVAKHEGYDVNKTSEFFEKYGSYVLTMMQMVKHGSMAGHPIVPPLEEIFKLAEGIEVVQKDLGLAKHSIESLVEETISFIHDQKNSIRDDLDSATSEMEPEKQEVLSGADLSQLESYLTVWNKSGVLSNLYRIVTEKGHVKWVCKDHYSENYKEPARNNLRDVVKNNRGTFIEETGKIVIQFSSSTPASQFYEAMVNARGILELDVTLEWGPTMEDLKNLSTCITQANVVSFVLRGDSFSRPIFDVFNRSCRYNPLVDIMLNGRIQTMHFNTKDDFLFRVYQPTLMPAQLRDLSLSTITSLHADYVWNPLREILQSCSKLTTFSIQCFNWRTVISRLPAITSLVPLLERFHISDRDTSLDIFFSQGNIIRVLATVPSFQSHALSEVVMTAHLTHLTLSHTYTYGMSFPDVIDWKAVLSKCPTLVDIKVRFPISSCFRSIQDIVSAREQMLARQVKFTLRRFEILGTSNDRQVKDHSDIGVIAVDFKDPETLLSLPYIDTVHFAEDQDTLNSILREYGWSVKVLVMTNVTTDYIFSELVDLLKKQTFTAERLVLDPSSLSTIGLKRLGRFIDCTMSTMRLEFVMKRRDVGSQCSKALPPLLKYGTRLGALELHDSLNVTWMSSLPPTVSFLNLDSFSVVRVKDINISHDAVAWIVATISGSPKVAGLPPSVKQSWVPLKVIRLVSSEFHANNWKLLLEAIDFSALKELDVEKSNFSLKELEVLVDCLPDSTIPLKSIIFEGSHVAKCKDTESLEDLITELKEKVPSVEILGTVYATCKQRSNLVRARFIHFYSNY